MIDESEHDLAIVGSYAEAGAAGLTSYQFNADSFKRCDTADECDPSFIDVLPSESLFVAVNEVESGSAVSYRVDPESGQFDFLDQTETGDAGPCHIEIGPRGEYAVVAHYVGGSVALLSLETDGTVNGPLDLRRHQGSGPNDDRQESPHPHSARFISDSIVYVPDLGTDRVIVYKLDRDAGRLYRLADAEIDCRPGSGPRHFAVHPSESVGYLVNELNATLAVVDITDPRRPSIVDSQSTLSDGVDASETIAADVHVHPSGDYVFASNRGDDSIATFRIHASPDDVTRLTVTTTAGRWPRNFAIHPSGNQIFVCHQHSDDIGSLTFDVDTGELRRTKFRMKTDTPTCLQFM